MTVGVLEGKRLLNVLEFAQYIGTTPMNVYQMKSSGQIPEGVFVKRGRSLRFDRIATDLWIEGQKHGNSEDRKRP